MKIALLAGDVIYTAAKGGGLISKSISWWTRAWREPPTKASHVAMVLNTSLNFPETLIGEQTFPRQQPERLKTYLDGSTVIVYRNKDISPTTREQLADQMSNEFGKRYGKWKIMLFLADAIIGKILSIPIVLIGWIWKWRGIEPLILSRLNLTNDIVCSQTVAKYYWNSGIHFGGSWQTRNPDNMLDYCEQSSQWELVYSNE